MSVSKSTPKPILEALQKALASGPAQKREDEYYKSRKQPYWHHDGNTWKSSWSPRRSTLDSPDINPKAIRLVSWNIDMLIGFAEERMSAALDYLASLDASTPSEVPIIIFLQEMCVSDIQQIKEAPWIQRKFYLTDIDGRNWLSDVYGTTILVDRRLKINGGSSPFRVPWISKFDRDGLFVDIEFAGGGKFVRFCNTHLESLVADPPVRPLQLQAAAPYLQDSDVVAALLAGDLNAIQPFDRTLHSENNLKDAYLELGGEEDSDDGYTWGYQVPQALRDKFGCSRMDKIFFRGALQLKSFQRIGVGVKVAEEKKQEMRDAGEEEWVTDHYGVMGDFEFTHGWEFPEAGGGKNPLLPMLA